MARRKEEVIRRGWGWRLVGLGGSERRGVMEVEVAR